MASHAQNPLPEVLGGGYFRVHFAARDVRNRAHGGAFVFHIENPSEILEVTDAPTIGPGPLGAFDDSGAMPGSIVHYNGRTLMYYTGWSKTVDVPFAFHIGLAASNDGKVYDRVSLAPVLGRSHFDPYITGAPYVMLEGDRFRMWYVSGTEWAIENEGEKPKHYYTVKHAESSDGISWECSDQLCLDYLENEYAIARPVVWKEEDVYRMWFSFRGGSDAYRVGVAESVDGIHWRRGIEPLGLDVSPEGWDADMICYAHPVFHEGRLYALYNGNDYGATGIGLAVLE